MINYEFEHENVYDELVARGYFEQATYEDEYYYDDSDHVETESNDYEI